MNKICHSALTYEHLWTIKYTADEKSIRQSKNMNDNITAEYMFEMHTTQITVWIERLTLIYKYHTNYEIGSTLTILTFIIFTSLRFVRLDSTFLQSSFRRNREHFLLCVALCINMVLLNVKARFVIMYDTFVTKT